MKNLFQLLTKDKQYDLHATLRKPHASYEALVEGIKTLTDKDVRFLQELLESFNDGKHKYGDIISNYYHKPISNGSFPYKLIATKALAFILAMQEGREPESTEPEIVEVE